MEDEETKRLMKKAERGDIRGIDPHLMDQLKKKVETQQKKKAVAENQKKALEGLQKQREAAQKQMQDKGVQNTEAKQDMQQLIKQMQQQKEAEKEVGGTEQATGSVG